MLLVGGMITLAPSCYHSVKSTNNLTLFYLSGSGVQWSNIDMPPNIDDDFTILHCVLFLVFDIIFYSIITWYVDEVKPGQYGLLKPLYFPFTVRNLF